MAPNTMVCPSNVWRRLSTILPKILGKTVKEAPTLGIFVLPPIRSYLYSQVCGVLDSIVIAGTLQPSDVVPHLCIDHDIWGCEIRHIRGPQRR